MNRFLAFCLLLFVVACGRSEAPQGPTNPIESVTQESLQEEANAHAQPTNEPNRYWIVANDTPSFESPAGVRNGSFDRGESFLVTDHRQGWLRANPLNAQVGMWVREADASSRPPPALSQPPLSDAQRDARIQGIPLAGEDGADGADVIAMRAASAQLLADHTCIGVQLGSVAVNNDPEPRPIPKTYFITCQVGQSDLDVRNYFFTTRRGSLQNCGLEVEDCDRR